jgi:hypothetical protein
VAKFADQVRRAVANGQIINIEALIPPVMSSVLEYELKAYKRPSIHDSDLDQLLASLQFLATGQKSGIETARLTEEFFKKVSNFL